MKIPVPLLGFTHRITSPFLNSRGMFLVFIALGIFVILGMAALAIDYGYWALTRSRLHAACDAAALAGARALDGSAAQAGKAQDAAIAVAGQNRADARTVVLAAGDVQVGNWEPAVPAPTPQFDPNGTPLNAVRVQAVFGSGSNAGTAPVNTFFARIFGISSVTVGARCTAAKSPPPILPIAANEYWNEKTGSLSGCATIDYPNQVYPNSFLRSNDPVFCSGGTCSTNVGNPADPGCRAGLSSTLFGKVFQIVSPNPLGNASPSNDKGWIDLRNSTGWYMNTSGEIWHALGSQSPDEVITQGGYSGPTPSLVNELYLAPYPVSPGAATAYNNPWSGNTPDPLHPQTCVSGGAIPASRDPLDQTLPCDNHISLSPYATVDYVGGLGNTIKNMYNDPQKRYEPGTDVIVFVYDGIGRIHSGQGRITLLGAAVVKICGYGGPNDLGLFQVPGGNGTCLPVPGSRGNTLYAAGVIPLTTDFNAILNQASKVHLVQ